MKKIIQVVDSLNVGGAERVAVDLANGLLQLGYQVFFCITREDGPLNAALSDGLKVVNLNRNKSLEGLWTFRRYVKRNKIDIVHAHGNSTALFCTIALLGLKKIRIIHHDHNSLLNTRNVFIHKMILKRVYAWIAVSAEIRDWVVSKVGHVKTLLIINPVLISRFSKLQGHINNIKQVVVLANYREPKDYVNLLNAVQLLRLKSPNLMFKVNCYGSMSDSEYSEKIQNLKAQFNLGGSIELNPSVQDVPQILSRADIGVLSSSREGLPISLLEYMAASLPVIVTDVGECKRIVREANCGVITSPSDPSKLAAAIEETLLHEERWNEWGINARNFVEQNHSMKAFLQRIIKDAYGL